MFRLFKKNALTLAVSLLLVLTVFAAPIASAAVLGEPAEAISVGSKVKIIRGASDYNGMELSRAYYYFDFNVKSISGKKASLERTLTIKEIEQMGVSIPTKVESVLSSLDIKSYTLTLDASINDLYLASEPTPEDTVTDFNSYKNITLGSTVYIYNAVDYYGAGISPLYTFVDLKVTAISGDKVTVENTIKLTDLIDQFGLELPSGIQAAMGLLPSDLLSMDVRKEVKLNNLILVNTAGSNNGSYSTGTYTTSRTVEGYDKIPTSNGSAERILTIAAGKKVVVEEVKDKWGKICVDRTEAYVDLTKLVFITKEYMLVSDDIKVGDIVNITEETTMYSEKSQYAYEYLMDEFGFDTHEKCFSAPFTVEGDRKSHGDRVHLAYFDDKERVYIAIEVPVSEVIIAEGTYLVDGTISKLCDKPNGEGDVKKVFTEDSEVVIDSVEGRWGHTYIDGMEGYVDIDTLTFDTNEKKLFTDDFDVFDVVKLKKDATTYFGNDILEEIEETTGDDSLTKSILFSSELRIIEGYSDYLVLYLELDNGMSYNFNTSIHDVKLVRSSDLVDVYGDINDDGKLSMQDVTMLQRAIAELITLSDKAEVAADVNGDGKTTLRDVTGMQRKIAGIIDEFDVE